MRKSTDKSDDPSALRRGLTLPGRRACPPRRQNLWFVGRPRRGRSDASPYGVFARRRGGYGPLQRRGRGEDVLPSPEGGAQPDRPRASTGEVLSLLSGLSPEAKRVALDPFPEILSAIRSFERPQVPGSRAPPSRGRPRLPVQPLQQAAGIEMTAFCPPCEAWRLTASIVAIISSVEEVLWT